jgi:hypothetical protein
MTRLSSLFLLTPALKDISEVFMCMLHCYNQTGNFYLQGGYCYGSFWWYKPLQFVSGSGGLLVVGQHSNICPTPIETS